MMLLNDEEILNDDLELKAAVSAHHALDEKNGREPQRHASLVFKDKVARLQLKKVVDRCDGKEVVNGYAVAFFLSDVISLTLLEVE